MQEKNAGYVWIFSGVALLIYALLTILNQNIPGVEQLVSFVESISIHYILLAAFLVIFIEGLYVVGSFFPGSTLVVILAVLSNVDGFNTFLLTILSIFLGWCLAGFVNILFASLYRGKLLGQVHAPQYAVKDRPLTTWFPAFRANYEVAQILEGGGALEVLLSSFRVKLVVSSIMLVITYLLPMVIDVREISNEEGALSLLIVVTISFVVGTIKIRNSRHS